ncbi:MAG: NAD(P)-dependent oxidoreductase [Acidimicrobiia bacterium]
MMETQGRALDRVGFVGLGNQGGPMAHRIVRGGFDVSVWARRPNALDEFRESGCDVATSLRELAETCPMIAVCVTTDDDVRSVTLSHGGLVESMPPGSTLAVHSTVHPDTVREVHDVATARGVAVLDAPVSGGNAAAIAGRMTVLCGGATALVDRWRPVFATHAAIIERLGGIGAGQVGKLLSNALSSLTLGASMWALDSASTLGLDRDVAFRLLLASSGDNFMLHHVPAIEAGGAAMAASLLRKDLDLYAAIVRNGDGAGATMARVADEALRLVEELASRQRDGQSSNT